MDKTSINFITSKEAAEVWETNNVLIITPDNTDRYADDLSYEDVRKGFPDCKFAIEKTSRETRPSITNLGKAREADFGSSDKKRPGEIFYSIEKMNLYTQDYKRRSYGYMQISPEIQTILNRLIQDKIVKAHIYIIEWYDSYNVVFEDGLFISQVCYRMEKENFEKWEKQIIPKG